MKDKEILLLKLTSVLGKTSGLLQGLQHYDLPDDIKEIMNNNQKIIK